MENVFIELKQKGLAGLEEIFDSGWGYCLPNAPYRLYEVLKRTQGNSNSESWNSYKRLQMQTRLDPNAISNSIQFLLLLGFITYESGVADHRNNRYSVTNFVNILVFQEANILNHLISVVQKVRSASDSPSQSQKFNKQINIMNEIVERFSNGSIQKIPNERRIKKTMFGEKDVRGLAGDVIFFEKYENTFKEIRKFMDALYSAFRNGLSIKKESCNSFCREGKCRCFQEIEDNDRIHNFLLFFTGDSLVCTDDKQVHDNDSLVGGGEVQDNNEKENILKNIIKKEDDETGQSSKIQIDSEVAVSTRKQVEETLKFFFEKEETESYYTIIKQIPTSISEKKLKEILNVVLLIKESGYPCTPNAYFPKVFAKPDLNLARNTIRKWQTEERRIEYLSKGNENRMKEKKAKEITNRTYYDEIFKSLEN